MRSFFLREMEKVIDQSCTDFTCEKESMVITDTEYFQYIYYIDPAEDGPCRARRDDEDEDPYWENVEERGYYEYGHEWLIDHWDNISNENHVVISDMYTVCGNVRPEEYNA